MAEPKGVVYTKRWVVELMLDLSGYSPQENLVDMLAIEPAAGEGAFLEPMIERLLDSCQQFGRNLSECRHSLLAYEVDEPSAARARLLATRILLHHGADRTLAEELAGEWVVTKDYLFDVSNQLQADFVIGNPPYVRLEDIPEDTATVYRNMYPTMQGRADLYVAFFEAALRQLKSGGVCAFICADRWMRNHYGAKLRQLITSAYDVEVILSMHEADAFHDAVDAYPAITIIRHTKQRMAAVASAGPEIENLPPNQLAAIIRGGQQTFLPPSTCLRLAHVQQWFKGTDPWPCHSPEQLTLLRRLEDHFSQLETSAKIGIGVATGNDGIYITPDDRLVETSRLLKLALAKDLSSGELQWSGHYLVNPWDSDGLVDLTRFPKLKAYYEAHAADLKKRHTAEKCTRGWYKTIDRVNHELLAKQKLYIPDIKNTLEPVLDRGETYPHHNLYFVQSDEWDLEVLGGLLLSALGQFFVESYGIRMRGGYLRFQAQYLRRIRVPQPAAVAAKHARELRKAFHRRDRQLATEIALQIYGIERSLMEAALEH
ncbi:MAG: Eco57I restriction-modification methylase domain-containing protein [Nitrospira sp.]|nr:Eco57I restriction-modification methylase domain-containing protein [Nitrospira sp.]